MEAKDLRLGNYVRRKTINSDGIVEESYEVLVVNSSTISKLEVGSILSRADGYTVFVEPIPLTEEWLLKFGFAHFNAGNMQIAVLGFFAEQYWYNSNTNSFKISQFKDGSFGYQFNSYKDKGSELKYLHQLQNLYFALTGEELTIKE